MNEHYVLKGINTQSKILGIFTIHTIKLLVIWLVSATLFFEIFEKNIVNIVINFYLSSIFVFLNVVKIREIYLDEILTRVLIYLIKNKIWLEN